MPVAAQPSTRRHGNETSQALVCRTPDQRRSRHRSDQQGVPPTELCQPDRGRESVRIVGMECCHPPIRVLKDRHAASNH
jgi:hypothetical protein